MQTISNADRELLSGYAPVHLHLYISGASIPSQIGSFTMNSAVGDDETSCGASIAGSIVMQVEAEHIVRALATQSGYLVNAETGETIVTSFNWSQQTGASNIIPIIATQSGYVLQAHDGNIISVQFIWKQLTGTGIKITWDVDGEAEYNLFQGRIETVTVAGGRATITAQDELFWNGSRTFKRQNEFSTDSNATTVLSAIADGMGVALNSATESLLSSVTISGGFSSCRDNLTYYQAAGYIAALVGGNAVINRDGELAVVKYHAVDFETEPYSGECSAENTDYTTSGVSFQRTYINRTTNPDGTVSEYESPTTYKAGDGSLSLENPLADQTATTRAFNALRSFASRKGQYSFPMGIQIEPGDIITINSMDGTYPVAVCQIQYDIDGGVKSTVTGAGQSKPNGVVGTVVEEVQTRGGLLRSVGSSDETDDTDVLVPGRNGPLTQRVENLELEVLRVKNLQAENAEIVSAKIQNLFAEDILCTNKFEVNNDAWRLIQDNDGCTIATKELNALSQDPVGEFKIGSSYGYIACNHVNDGNVFYRAMVLVNAELGNVSIECGNTHADFENDAITIGNPEGVLWIMQGKFSVNALSGIEMGHNVYPAEYGTEVSGVYSLGTSTARWSTVYLTSNPNVSSDRDAKQDIYDSVPDIVDNLIPVSYRLKDDPDGRIHYGFIAQDVEEALIANEVDTDQIGLVRFDADRDGSKTNYSLAYDELIPILTEKIKKQQDQIDSLQDRLDRLERMMNNG